MFLRRLGSEVKNDDEGSAALNPTLMPWSSLIVKAMEMDTHMHHCPVVPHQDDQLAQIVQRRAHIKKTTTKYLKMNRMMITLSTTILR
jgi:hypothetical protein